MSESTKKAFKVYNFIVGKGGEIELSELAKHPSPLQSLTEEDADEWLKEFAELDDKEAVIENPCFIVGKNSEGKTTVRVFVKARLCLNYEKNGVCRHGVECLQFHVCKGFLEGRCSDTNLCSRSHDLLDKENLNKTIKYRLEHLSNSSIRKVVVKNLPFVCKDYVNAKCGNPCCKNLHVCSRFVKTVCEEKEGDCPFRLSHDLHSQHNRAIIKDYGIPSKYLLFHILVTKDTRIEVIVKEEGKRKGKVNKLNNLNSNEEHKQVGGISKVPEMPGNISNNISVNESSKSQKNKSKQKKSTKSNEPSVQTEELNIKPGLLPTPSLKEKRLPRREEGEGHFILPSSVRDIGRHGQPTPLMGLPLAQPYLNIHQKESPFPVGPTKNPYFKEAFQEMLFPQGHGVRDQNARGGRGNIRGGNIRLEREGRRWKSMDSFNQPSPTGQFSSMRDQKEQEFNKPGIAKDGGRGSRGVRGRGSWRGRGRGVTPHGDEESSEKETEFADSFSKEDDDSTEPTKESRKRRARVRRKKSGNKDKRNLDEKEEEVEELKQNLMEFQLEDEEEKDLIDWTYVVEDNDDSVLVDLNFETDPGLSQMSDAQAKWDLFSQDQLYDDEESLHDEDLDSTASNPNPFDSSCQSSESTEISVASANAVFKCILMEFNGIVSFSEISARVDLFHPDFEEHEKWFRKHKSSFLVIDNPEGHPVEIKAFSLRAKMCFKYCGKGCNSKNCTFFHVCKEYIAKGRCESGAGCRKNHGFSDNHNKQIASKLFPRDHFTDEQLLCLVQSSTPQVCLEYNNGTCLKGKRCSKIHICKNYGNKKCPRGSCKLAHNNAFSTPATKDILKRFKIKGPPDVTGFFVAKTLLVCDDSHVEEKPQAKRQNSRQKAEPVDTSLCCIQSNLQNHICMKFLLNQCKRGAKCSEHHCPMPYQWIYSTDKWQMLNESENTNLERLFCKEGIASTMIPLTLDCSSSSASQAQFQNIQYIYNVDFIKMQVSPLDEEEQCFTIKRLSTESDVHIPDCPLTTQWHWFWKNPDEKFIEYQPIKDAKEPTSATIERHFLEGHSMYDFSVKPHNYRLYFRKTPMCQKNMDPQFYTEREVCRRPQYVSTQEFEAIKSKQFKLPVEDSRQIPSMWTKMARCQEFLLFQLKSNSKEFKEMKMLFLNSVGEKKVTINSIDRVQNPFMMEKYLRKKNHMEKLAGAINSKSVEERFLFHGTSHRNIRPICKQNFDWRLYGEVTGNIYGEGAYFARDSSLSDCYCPEDDDGVRYIFVAKVLVGSYTQGEKKYKRPPQKDPDDPHSDLFDSCVDSVQDPKIFVVFDVDQYYPGYLVEYTRHDTEHLKSFSSGTTLPKSKAPPRPTAAASYTYQSSSVVPSAYNPSSSQVTGAYSSNTQGPGSPSYVSAGVSILQNAMEKQLEEYTSGTSTSKKSSQQQNCLVM